MCCTVLYLCYVCYMLYIVLCIMYYVCCMHASLFPQCYRCVCVCDWCMVSVFILLSPSVYPSISVVLTSISIFLPSYLSPDQDCAGSKAGGGRAAAGAQGSTPPLSVYVNVAMAHTHTLSPILSPLHPITHPPPVTNPPAHPSTRPQTPHNP